MDISETLAPTSDQLDAIDLQSSGPRTFTITKVSKGNSEQPVQVHLAEFPRVWRPGKSMRRVLAKLWTEHADTWIGKRVTLYCDDRVKFGNDVVGGTRISHMSDIGDKPASVLLLVSKGRSATFTVQPLAEAAQTTATISTATLADLIETFKLKGIPEAAWLTGVNQITGGNATDLEVITEEQGQQVLSALASRPDVNADEVPA